jgi:butyrate kinase
MTLTTTILVANSFVLGSDGRYTNGDYSVDSNFHLIHDEMAYSICKTVAELQAALDGLTSGITLV